jgi:hypothetical protein
VFASTTPERVAARLSYNSRAMNAAAVRRAISLVVLAVLLIALGWLGWSRWGSLTASEATLQGAYPTEEAWIAGEIVRDIVEMAQYARDPNAKPDAASPSLVALTDGAGPGVTVSFRGISGAQAATVRWTHHIWAAQDYEELARAGLAGRTPVAAGPDGERGLTALARPMAGVIELENQRVSQRLRTHMVDAEAHEDAALILGTFLFREAAGDFADVRTLLCRMTAHLALARALRSGEPYGASGRYAEVILEAGSGRSAEALRLLDALDGVPSNSAVRRGWGRALRIWVTSDWRLLSSPQQATLLERIAQHRALMNMLGPAAAFAFYQAFGSEPVPDWSRTAFAGAFGTEVGGFAHEGADPELSEAREVWLQMGRGEVSRSDVVRELNRPAERCLGADGPRVLAWGTWAAAAQRHVCHRVLRIDAYWRNVVALPDRAAASLAAFDRQLGGLDLYPFVQGLRWHHGGIELESFSAGLNDGVSTAARRPELVPARAWKTMSDTARYAVTRRRMPAPRPWFAVPALPGAAYEAESRMELPGAEQPTSAALDALHARNPWSGALSERVVMARHGAAPTPEQIGSIYGGRADYDLGVVRWRAKAAGGGSPDRERFLRQACDLVGDECAELAHHLIAGRRDSAAMQALELAFDRAVDRVGLSHHILPLVRHYHDAERPGDATRVAGDAVETGSARGMEAMGLLLEWRGDYGGAEEQLKQIEERYEEKQGLIGFYKRMVDAGRQEYGSRLSSGLRDAFPNGLEKLDPAQLPAVPADGVGVSDAGPEAPLTGIQTGDIIVGLDGWRVRDLAQYQMVREFDWKPDMTLYVWRKGRYVEARPHALNRLFGGTVHTHPVAPQ